jgi:ribosomal protein S18 acetylase RimI-like enzyme
VRQEYPDRGSLDDRAPQLLAGCIDIIVLDAPGILCLAGDKLVGLLAYIDRGSFPLFRIYSFAVDPRFQRNGIGTALINQLKRKAITRGLSIHTMGDVLSPAIGCLQKAGFQPDGSIDRPGYEWHSKPVNKPSFT